MRSRITDRVIMFGACEDHDHEDYEEEMKVNNQLAITSIDDISLADDE